MDEVEVEEVFPDIACKTRLWWSQAVMEEVLEYVRRKGKIGRTLLDKLQYWAQAGFGHFERSHNCPIKHEEGEAFRISDGGLFRIAGFYENETKKDFIAISAFRKRGQKNSSVDRRHYENASNVKEKSLWRRKGTSNEQYPRIVENSP
jgi:hypothetical protein